MLWGVLLKIIFGSVIIEIIFKGDVILTNERGCIELNENMENVLTCNTSLCNSFDNYPIVDLEKDTNYCYKSFGDHIALDDDVGCYVKVAENQEKLYVYAAERGCANNTLVEQDMIHVCNSSLCNSPDQFPLDGKAMALVKTCYSMNDQEEEVKDEHCKVGAVGCFVEILNQNGYKYSKNRGCAYESTPSEDNKRITCKSSRCNSVEKYGPSQTIPESSE
uniref:Uncharacterized protein n=1 Tax=Panagrolaimus sp. JU765 TaxID=591449 RepID=A0AC34RBA8_9BILA